MMRPFTGPFDCPLTRRNAVNFLLGIVNAIVLCKLSWTLAATTVITAAFVLVAPPAMGLLAAATWGDRRYSDHTRAKAALLITLGGLATSYPFVAASLGEDAYVYAPVMACLTFVGVVLGMLFAEARRSCQP